MSRFLILAALFISALTSTHLNAEDTILLTATGSVINPGGPEQVSTHALPPEFPSATETTPAVENDQFSQFYAEFFRMLLMLGLIVVLLMIVTLVLKRMINARMNQINGTSNIQVLEKRPLSAKTMLYVVEISGRKMLLAESHNGVTAMQEFAERPDFDKMMDEKA